MAGGSERTQRAGWPDRPLVVGWKEVLDLPALGLYRVKAKLDTGARTSTLHVDSLAVVERLADGSEMVELRLSPSRRPDTHPVLARARLLKRVAVVDSGGHSEVRPLIETELVLGPVRKSVLLTLTDRSAMLFRMILGRKALERDFVVDVTRKYVLRRWHRAPRRR